MNTILLILTLAAFPTVIGFAAVKIFNSIRTAIKKTVSFERESVFCRISTYFTTGSILLILVAGATNILAVLLNLTLSKAGSFFNLSILALFILSLIFSAIKLIATCKASGSLIGKNNSLKKNRLILGSDKKLIGFCITAIIFALIQIVYLARYCEISYIGDQILETVVAFTTTDRLYSVDPLTGQPYLNGYPFRLALQCLPFLYSVLARTFSVTPSVLVWNIMPIFWLLCGYCSMLRIADSLLNKPHHKMLCFVIFQFLLWCSDAAFGATGYNLFHCGSSPVVVLELLVINWTIGTLLSGNYFAAILTIATEPIVTSTQYGVGICAFITAAFIILSRIPIVKRVLVSVSEKKGGSDGKA